MADRPLTNRPQTNRPLTLMAVHAHPDDEATGTGGVLARYAAEGIRTVLVTCTDGCCGDGPGGVKPGEPGHDPAAVVAMRRSELEASCEVLKVSDLELLGYADSGMMGWPNNDAPGSFWKTPVDEAAARLAELMRALPARRRRHLRRERLLRPPRPHPGAPDHDGGGGRDRLPAKVYWTTVPRSMMEEFGEIMREFGADWDEPEPSADGPRAGDRPAGRRDHHVGRHHRVRRSEVRRARRARQPEREHLLPADGQGAVHRADGHGDVRAGQRHHRSAVAGRRSVRRPALRLPPPHASTPISPTGRRHGRVS